MEREEAYTFLRDVAENMYQAIWREYDRHLEALEKGRITYKEFGKRLDYSSARALKEYLEREGLRFRVYSEEWFEDYRPGDDEEVLVVDPIDGTSNFSRGIKYSAISLAISKSRRFEDIYSGYVLNLYTRESYFAYRGYGSYKNGTIGIRVSRVLKTIDAFISIAITHQIPGRDRSLDILRYTNYPRHLGSAALEDCLVAEGRLDAHIDVRGSLRVYDIAASQLIVSEAGGKVWINQYGEYPSIEKIHGIKIISAATPHLLEKILDILGM